MNWTLIIILSLISLWALLITWKVSRLEKTITGIMKIVKQDQESMKNLVGFVEDVTKLVKE